MISQSEYWLDPEWDPYPYKDPGFDDKLADIYYAMKEEDECLELYLSLQGNT